MYERKDAMLETAQSVSLTPVLVRDAKGAHLTVLLDGLEVQAVNALAFPYQPSPGDVVLLIAQEDARYVIGVLQAQGDMTLNFPAGVHLRAPRGSVQITSGVSLEMQAPDVQVTAGRWNLLARTLKESATNAYRWVKELASLKAGRQRTMVEGANYERAERRIIKAKKDVRVDGDRIHLG
jgi:hypothetical protein